MRLTQIRRSNRAKLARLEARGYIFSEEYKQYVANAKGKLATKNIRAKADIIFDRKKGDLYIRGIDYSDVQLEKAKTEMYKYFNALRGGDTEKAEHIKRFVLSGEISDRKPKRLSLDQETEYKARLASGKISDTSLIPEYGTQEYWEWRDFQRNRETFIYYGVEHGMSLDFMEAAANDPGIMYRYNNSDTFIERYIYNDMSEQDQSVFLDEIIGKDFIEDYYSDINDEFEVDAYEMLLQSLQ